MKDAWEKAYVYGRTEFIFSKIAHIVPVDWDRQTLCGVLTTDENRTPKPYPVCKNCLKTKRAKELGLT